VNRPTLELQLRRYGQDLAARDHAGEFLANGVLPGATVGRADPSRVFSDRPPLEDYAPLRSTSASGRRRLAMVAAALVLMVGTAGALIASARDDRDPVGSTSKPDFQVPPPAGSDYAAVGGTYVIPPSGATEISLTWMWDGINISYLSPEGQLTTITNLNRESGGTDVNTGQHTFHTAAEVFAAESGGQGVGRFHDGRFGEVLVRCESEQSGAPGTGSPPVYRGPHVVVMLLDGALLRFSTSSPPGTNYEDGVHLRGDWLNQPCTPPTTRPAVLDQLVGLRVVDDAGWDDFVANEVTPSTYEVIPTTGP
jgi:hypothetical protein